MKKALKKLFRKIGYRFFLMFAICLKYNFLLFLIGKKNRCRELSRADQQIIARLKRDGCVKVRLEDLNIPPASLEAFGAEVRSRIGCVGGNVVLQSDQVMNTKFAEGLLANKFIKQLCEEYFDYPYLLRECAVWRNVPNGGSWAYRGWHFDRNHLKSLHFDLNISDVGDLGGAVEVISARDSLKLGREFWGGEFQKSSLLDQNVYISGDGSAGTITIYDGMRTLHRGGITEEGERFILHIVVSENVYWRKENYTLNHEI